MSRINTKMGISILLFCSSNLIYAQTINDHKFERKGFFIGTSLGSSVVNFSTTGLPSQTYKGLSLDWKIGTMVTERMAIVLVGGPSSIYNYNGIGRPRKRGFEVLIPSIQYWKNDRLWLLGGIGLTADAPVFYDLKTENEGEQNYYWGRGMILGAGYDLWRRGTFALDIQSKLHYGYVDVPEGKKTGLALNVSIGLNWY